jgi:MinD superfamily P-loop ATPase
MKEIVIISGKGGTGKTSIISAFASLAENKVLCDADVDAADLHLIMAPEIKERHDFDAGHTAKIDPDKCTECDLCRELVPMGCHRRRLWVDEIECEGCGVCYYFCPEKAIEFPINTCGEWFISNTRFGPMAHARWALRRKIPENWWPSSAKKGGNWLKKRGLTICSPTAPPA